MQTAGKSPIPNSTDFRNFLLAQIRVDAIEARLRAAQITEIGFALSVGAITATDAVADLLDLGCDLSVPSSIAVSS